MSTTAIRTQAKQLVALSLEGGAVSAERVNAVLSALAKSRRPHQLRPLLRVYLSLIRREVAKGEARIEHAGPLSDAVATAIATHFSQSQGRPVRAVARRNDSLLGGFRVRVGDDVIDASVALRLANLAKALA